MKTKYAFEIMELDDGIVAVPVGEGAESFRGLLKLNETGLKILKLLESDSTEEMIVDELIKEYSGDISKIKEYTHAYIEQLISEGVIK